MKTITATLMLSLLGSVMAQDREIVVSGDNFYVDIPFTPSEESVYTYLWWFGDSGYKITYNDYTTHTFHNDYTINTNYNKYVTSLLATETYGTGTGEKPHMISVDVSTPLDEETTSSLPKHLDPNDSLSFIRSINYRDAVPGDTLYLMVTYGLPNGEAVLGEQQMNFYLDFGDDNEDFEYLNDRENNLSFLPNQEYPIGVQDDSTYRWRLHAWTYAYALQPGEERTMLLPFKYHGTKTSGDAYYNMRFERKIDDETIQFETTSIGCLYFAESHDPNRTQVSLKETECAVGGEELAYDVYFHNTGEGATKYVRIEVQMHEAHDLSTIKMTRLPRWFESIEEDSIRNHLSEKTKKAYYEVDYEENKVTFEFHNIFLIGSLDTIINDPARAKDFIKFTVDVKEDYEMGKFITASADIFFDRNSAVSTNQVVTSCPNPTGSNSPIAELEQESVVEESPSFEIEENPNKFSDLGPINFDSNASTIRSDAAKELDKAVAILNKNPEMEVELQSHTDCRGSKAYNEKLSDQRAKSSAAYIKARITNPERIYGKGYGESELLNNCACEGSVISLCDDQEHEKNRRTEFIIISNGEDNIRKINPEENHLLGE